MRKLKIITWILTVVFFILFILNTVRLSNIKTEYGNLATSFPILLGSFIGYALIPGIFWIIITIKKNKTKSNDIEIERDNSELKILNSELTLLKKEINNIEPKELENQRTISIILKSFEQNLISKEKFQAEETKINADNRKLNESKENLQKKTDNILKRIEAIESLQHKLSNLTTLQKKGIITNEECKIKQEELIKSFIDMKHPPEGSDYYSR
jgi:hypothetical protein